MSTGQKKRAEAPIMKLRFEARYGRRPEFFFPLYCYDIGRMMMSALAGARPLTGRGVKEALERKGWVGSEYLVARRVLPDGSRRVLHGTIEGLVRSPESAR